jgi:membrane-bound lytic murein transglycosylase A
LVLKHFLRRRGGMSTSGTCHAGVRLRKRALELFMVLLLGAGLLALGSCHGWLPKEAREPFPAMVPVEGSEIPVVQDDMEWDSLRRAIQQSLVFLERVSPERSFQYGPVTVGVHEVRSTLRRLLEILGEAQEPMALAQKLRQDFIWFQVSGTASYPMQVLLTGYYLPRLEGRARPGGDFLYPVYSLPPDLMEVDLGLFREGLRGQRIVGRLQGQRLVPYFTRAQIDTEGALSGKGLEILWLRHPVDRFFLQVQGSGEVLLDGGKSVFLNYAGANGHPYRSIGKILVERGSIPADRVSMQTIREYLESHPGEMDELLLSNPSYVFFRVVPEGPLGNLEVPLTPGRSIATDSRLFPPAGLGVLCSTLPQPGALGKTGPRKGFCRLVLNQDTGGAIQGAGRADLYCGSGPEAEFLAGNLQDPGRLYFLLLRKSAESLALVGEGD